MTTPIQAALKRAADIIELFDDATMLADHMLDASECATVIRALADSPDYAALQAAPAPKPDMSWVHQPRPGSGWPAGFERRLGELIDQHRDGAPCKGDILVLISTCVRPDAPAQGSIDTEDERAAFEKAMNDARFFPRELDFGRTKSPSGRDEYANSHLQSNWKGWQARAHIAQRAASGDAWKVCGVCNGRGERDVAHGVVKPCKDCSGKGSIRAAPAPIADEVAGEWPTVLGVGRRFPSTAEATVHFSRAVTDDELMALDNALRPPAPKASACTSSQVDSQTVPVVDDKASAPDAPAGDLLPLPEAFGVLHYNRVSGFSGRLNGYTADQMHDFVLADRAARAAAAPAGHAEPVGEVRNTIAFGWCFEPSMSWDEIGDRTKLYAAPVAAEPLPAIPAQPGTTMRVVFFGDSLKRSGRQR